MVSSIGYASLDDLQAWARELMASREPDFVIGDPANPYLRRWWLIPRNEYCNVYLHEILRSDDDRAGHDHPWANSSFLIEGEYQEVTYYRNAPWLEMYRIRQRAGDSVRRFPDDTHRLIIPEGGRVVSLFVTGPKVREWGFWCPGDGSDPATTSSMARWIPWQEFCAPTNKGQIGRGCGE
jgi:hypothetical protein